MTATSLPPILVVVSLRGGADALNLLVPHGDPHYARLRPHLAIPGPKKGKTGETGMTGKASAADRTIDLDGFFGFHPALAPLLPLWRGGELAAVSAVGWPGVSHSHFEAWEEIECGAVGEDRPSSGWLARSLSGRKSKSSPLRAVAFADTMPRLLTGALGSTVVQGLEDLRLAAPAARRRAIGGALRTLYSGSAFPVGAAGLEVLDAIAALDRAAPQLGVSAAPSSGLGRALSDVAKLVRANVGLEAASVEIGGWDFHFSEGGASGEMAKRLAELAGAIADFRRDVGEHWSRIRLLAISEFGRRAAENGSGGTDHGQGGAFLVAGGRVRGGRVFGTWPGLAPDRLAGPGDLAITTDFRSVLSEALPEDTSDIERERIFPGFRPTPPLGLFSPEGHPA